MMMYRVVDKATETVLVSFETTTLFQAWQLANGAIPLSEDGTYYRLEMKPLDSDPWEVIIENI